MIKLIVCDLDGTLLNDRKQLDSQILEVLDALRKKHILFTLATGRNEAIVRDYVDQLGIEIPYAADNGAIYIAAIGYCKVKAYKKRIQSGSSRG